MGFKSTSLKLKAVSHKKHSFPHQFDAKQMPSHAAHVLLQYYKKPEIGNLKSQLPTKKLQKKNARHTNIPRSMTQQLLPL